MVYYKINVKICKNKFFNEKNMLASNAEIECICKGSNLFECYKQGIKEIEKEISKNKTLSKFQTIPALKKGLKVASLNVSNYDLKINFKEITKENYEKIYGKLYKNERKQNIRKN